MTLRILDPTVPPESPPLVARAPRADLDGAVVGLLANSKMNGDRLLHSVAASLGTRYRLREVIERTKPTSTRVAADALLDELAARCDAVITAIGD